MEFRRERHISYFLDNLRCLPEGYVGLDTSRMTALYFCVIGLDILGALDRIENKEEIIEFVYSMQLTSPNICLPCRGFVGSNYLCHNTVLCDDNYCLFYLETLQSHLAMTYSALCILITLGDDLSRIDKENIINGMASLQQYDGSFNASHSGNECDNRFLFCALAISKFLGDFSGVNIPLAFQYVRSCISYEGGMGLSPGLESHGGSTYCCIASLKLMSMIDQLSSEEHNDMIRWCVQRQISGFQGRCNKDPDSCYSFWIGGALAILGQADIVDSGTVAKFLLEECQCKAGFSKFPDIYPDLLHSFFSLSWLSFGYLDNQTSQPILNLNSVDPLLGITHRALDGHRATVFCNIASCI